MQKIIKLKNTLSGRMIMIYILCVFCPIVITSMYFSWKLEKGIRLEEENNFRISLERARTGVETCFDACMGAENFAATDDIIHEFIGKEYTSDLEFFQSYSSYISSVLGRYADLAEAVDEIYIYTENTTFTNAGTYRRIDDSVRKKEWYQEYAASGRDQKIVTGVKTHGYWDTVKMPFISIISKEINNESPTGQEVLFRLNVNIQQLYRILNAEKKYFEFYLLNEKNEIVLSTDKKYEPVNMKSLTRYTTIDLPEQAVLYEKEISSKSMLEGWKLAGVANTSLSAERMSETRIGVAVTALLCMIGAGVLMKLMARSYTSRIRLLHRSIENMKNQKFDRIVCEQTSDDMGELIVAFNQMSERIDTLVNHVYSLNLQKKDWEIEQVRAELNFLQSQLNPHFLFNTLNAILVVSMKHGYLEIIPILQNLSRLMRRLLNWSDEFVTVDEELKFVEMYAETEKFRFKEKFHYQIEAEEEARKQKIPKMTIQPLVENACKHGIQKCVEEGTVWVRVSLDETYLTIVIEDNGVGMSQDRIQTIETAMKEAAMVNECVGIRNVYRRLKLKYKENLYFHISPGEERGTVITIRVPRE